MAALSSSLLRRLQVALNSNAKGEELFDKINEALGAGGSQTDLIFDAATELTISSGAVTVTQAAHTVDTESDAASDNLDTVNGMSAEEIVVIRPASGSRTVVIRDAGVSGGNVYTPGGQSIELASANDWAMLVSDGTNLSVLTSCSSLSADGYRVATGTISGGDGAGNVGDLSSSPVTALPAPGADLWYEVRDLHLFLDYQSAAYDGTKTGNVSLYTASTQSRLVSNIAETGFMDQTSDQHKRAVAIAHQIDLNEAVVIASDNDWYSSAGDSPVKWAVTYRVRAADPTA